MSPKKHRIDILSVTLVAMVFCSGEGLGGSMPKSGPSNLSVLLYEAAGTALADQSVALGLARMLIERIYDKKERERQEPLLIEDMGESWLIRGAPSSPREDPNLPGVQRGAIELWIKKSNSEVVVFKLHATGS
jgi:hypothetical protein